MNLKLYRETENEKLRVSNLMGLIPSKGLNALDVGARDGFLSLKLIDFFETVTAVDLESPNIQHNRVISQSGNLVGLDFIDNSFDLVLCAEVLEHIPNQILTQACRELSRVTKYYLIVGVPYKQDLRYGRTTCGSCKKTNPPWGHVNRFDLLILQKLFPDMAIEKVEYVSSTRSKTNFISAYLMDLAGNPYGTYSQEEVCVHCGKKIVRPPQIGIGKKLLAKSAFYINNAQQIFNSEQANWVHVLFKKAIP